MLGGGRFRRRNGVPPSRDKTRAAAEGAGHQHRPSCRRPTLPCAVGNATIPTVADGRKPLVIREALLVFGLQFKGLEDYEFRGFTVH